MRLTKRCRFDRLKVLSGSKDSEQAPPVAEPAVVIRRSRAHPERLTQKMARPSNLYFRIRAMLHPFYWRCQWRRRLYVSEVTEGGSRMVHVDVWGNQGRFALEGTGCRFVFDAASGKLLRAHRTDWKGF